MDMCPHCQSPDLVGFTLSPSGQQLRFAHCRACEHRWWGSAADGGALVLDDVLERIAAS